MHPAARRLLEALATALPPFLASLGASPADADAVTRRLDELRLLLATPFLRQRRTPFEVVRAVVAAAGYPAPSSPWELGEAVGEAHLAWGAAKARALARPARIRWDGDDLMDRSRLAAAAAEVGAELVSGAAEADVAVVDLATPGAMARVEELVGAGVRVVAYGPHVAGDVLEAAARAGAEAYPRSVFFRDPSSRLAPQRTASQRKP